MNSKFDYEEKAADKSEKSKYKIILWYWWVYFPLAPLIQFNLVNEARIIVKTNPIIFNVKTMETKEINPLENPFETKGSL